MVITLFFMVYESMKRSRIKVLQGDAIYHCMSKAVPEMPFWSPEVKETMRRQLWRAAEFSGVRIITYCLMGNHFHVLVAVPDKTKVSISNEELLRRYKQLHAKPTLKENAHLRSVEETLKAPGTRAEALRQQLLARMHDVSEFMKTFKLRFSYWYNRQHDRRGTAWSRRFKSVLVENSAPAISTVAAYIDLNPVRAGLVEDPKDYRWCGYAEAVSGNRQIRECLCLMTGQTHTSELFKLDRATVTNPYQPDYAPSKALTDSAIRLAMAHYRMLLHGRGSDTAPGKAMTSNIPLEKVREVMNAEGKLSISTLLRSRLAYITHGLILGSRTFVKAQLFERLRLGEISRTILPRHVHEDALPDLMAGKHSHLSG